MRTIVVFFETRRETLYSQARDDTHTQRESRQASTKVHPRTPVVNEERERSCARSGRRPPFSLKASSRSILNSGNCTESERG